MHPADRLETDAREAFSRLARHAADPDLPADARTHAARAAAGALGALEPDERVFGEALGTLERLLDLPVALGHLLREVADRAPAERLAAPLLRLAKRAFAEERDESHRCLLGGLLAFREIELELPDAWGERIAARGLGLRDRDLVTRWILRKGVAAAWVRALPATAPALARTLPVALVILAHYEEPTPAGWLLLARRFAAPDDGLPLRAATFGERHAIACATLDHALHRAPSAQVELTLARWLVELSDPRTRTEE